jgi:hypothetical protein
MEKILTKNDVAKISKGITALFGKRFGVGYYAFNNELYNGDIDMQDDWSWDGDYTPLRSMVGYKYSNASASTYDGGIPLQYAVTANDLDQDMEHEYAHAKYIDGEWIVE